MLFYVKVFFLALVAASLYLAYDIQAFKYMCQFVWFRSVRNIVAFFFLTAGRFAADLFSKITGRSTPDIHQVHHATIFLVESFACILLVSAFKSACNSVVEWKGRKSFRVLEVKIMKMINHPIIVEDFTAETRPPSLQLPVFQYPPRLVSLTEAEAQVAEAARILAQETTIRERLQKAKEDASAVYKSIQESEKHFDQVLLGLNKLEQQYSLFSRAPDDDKLRNLRSRTLAASAELAGKKLRLSNHTSAITGANQESLNRSNSAAGKYHEAKEKLDRWKQEADDESKRQAARELEEATQTKERLRRELEAAVDVCNRLAAQVTQDRSAADAARSAAEKPMLQPAKRKPLGFAVVTCLILITAYNASKQASAPIIKSSSRHSELALFENYFEKSHFTHFVQVSVFTIVGA
jgi:hypothetical protein